MGYAPPSDRDWEPWIWGGAVVLVIGVLVALFILFPPIREGTVTGQKLVPAHWHRWTTSHCWSHDKNGNCTFRTYEDHEEWVPDACYVTLYNEKYKRSGDVGIDCATRDQYPNRLYVKFG